jgi:hypothetical protein
MMAACSCFYDWLLAWVRGLGNVGKQLGNGRCIFSCAANLQLVVGQ